MFDWFSLPSPFAQRNSTVHEIAEVAFTILAGSLKRSLFIFSAAVKHVVIDRDGVMRRMLAPAKS
ncbi:MAG: hypothetical protein R3C25_09040 [Hyphomonadaceae bacterium]